MSYLAFTFGILGNIVSFMVFLSPVPTFYRIYKKKTSEGYQSVPYIIGLFSAMLWIYYAFLKPNTTLLITINSFGCFIQTFYISFYLFYATKNDRIYTAKILVLLNVFGLGLVVLLTQFLAKGSNRAVIVGWVCLVFSLCVFVAPLCVMRQVIRTKSVEYMPFLLSLFLTISAVMWFFYGFLIKDYNIAIPNILGFSLGVVQMILYIIYKNAKRTNRVEEHELPHHKVQVIAVDDINNKIVPEIKEKIVDVEKLSAVMCPEIIPLVVSP